MPSSCVCCRISTDKCLARSLCHSRATCPRSEDVANKSRKNRACRTCRTRMLRGSSRGCPQQVVRVVLGARGLWRTTPTHGQTGSTTPQQTAGRPRGKLDGEVAGHARHARLVTDILARMSRGCYAETVPWNLSFILHALGFWSVLFLVGPNGACIVTKRLNESSSSSSSRGLSLNGRCH